MEARSFVLRGVLAGAAAGLVSWVFSLVFAEPQIEAAIAYEEGRGAAEEALAVAAGSAPAAGGEEEIVSRGVQATLGIGVGMVGIGIALGLLFAVAYTLLHGRVALRPRVLALVVAGAGFLTIYATPFLKYPASPPAVGSDETIGDRTALYLLMVIGSLAFLAAAVFVARLVREHLGTWNAVLVGGVVYVALSAVLMAVLPGLGELTINVVENGPRVSETPIPLRDASGAILYPGFDADVLYDFRLASFAAQMLLWGVLGLVFGALVERRMARAETSERPVAAAS
ncbi:CbtA family protein [Actinomycetospora cinnamomea]|uniref:Putative cobalt transporter subunit CbtA n=1 Tax=Actinomycetospora cinnamomea TaxID=663609 RepID=A0A2U1FMG4_9PSEU|nr:CbtA family protein [Actinomycetospora cinnamomea]PVZ13292.1 putative cobalt transporter subunit CbtA [Actinomycetospora cinnamomea]